MQAIKPLPKSALNEDGSFRVPDNLVAQPTDSEQEKEKKKRKIKVIVMCCMHLGLGLIVCLSVNVCRSPVSLVC